MEIDGVTERNTEVQHRQNIAQNRKEIKPIRNIFIAFDYKTTDDFLQNNTSTHKATEKNILQVTSFNKLFEKSVISKLLQYTYVLIIYPKKV